ncbi:helix-turn-helix domain-containing protein [Leucobacter sp. NPDC015123]|uniref:helix-turn-helix domain-containing protein n=1 Tax=Leucobacter sp. NPDC015123 TaxID=3364129 RepID=UPI0036F45DD2
MNRPAHQIDDARVSALLKEGMSNSAIARELGCNEASVRRAKKRLSRPTGDAVPTDVEAQVELNAATGDGSFTNVKTAEKLTDWTHVFEQFGLDPEEFEIVDDTVTMKAWQQSKRLENGDRDTVTLYSYGARFRRAREITLDLPALNAAANTSPQHVEGERSGRTTVVVWSDPQIGKVASRGGTNELIARSIAKRAQLATLLTERAPNECVLLDGGDGIEGFESGGNPMFTNDLSLARQLDLYGTELLEWVKVMLPYGQVNVLGVPSNHTAWRNAKQNLGNPGDDLGLFMHRQVARITEAAGLDITFHASAEYDESAVIDINGTRVGLVHGNQFGPGQAITWWEKQTFGAQAVATADVLVHGHYHSFSMNVAGRNPTTGRQRWCMGAPTLDNGSDWYRNNQGRDSDPGVLVFDITAEGFDLGSLTIL